MAKAKTSRTTTPTKRKPGPTLIEEALQVADAAETLRLWQEAGRQVRLELEGLGR